MTKNMGTIDRIIRSIVAVCFIVLFITDILSGALGIVLIVLSVIFLLTSFISFCPLYSLFNWNTKKAK